MGPAAGFLIIGAALVGIVVLAGKGISSASAAQTAVNSQAGASSGTLPKGAASKLNASQQQFASELASQTGLDPGVVAAWVLSEEPASSGSAPNGANNWLNIGSTDSGFYGAGNPAWASPKAAADFTASWMKGTADPGFGVASSGIQGILHSVGSGTSAQVSAIQNSGWASSGYPGLPQLVTELAG